MQRAGTDCQTTMNTKGFLAFVHAVAYSSCSSASKSQTIPLAFAVSYHEISNFACSAFSNASLTVLNVGTEISSSSSMSIALGAMLPFGNLELADRNQVEINLTGFNLFAYTVSCPYIDRQFSPSPQHASNGRYIRRFLAQVLPNALCSHLNASASDLLSSTFEFFYLLQGIFESQNDERIEQLLTRQALNFPLPSAF